MSTPRRQIDEPLSDRGEDTAPRNGDEISVEPDLSGWPPHPSERRDFYHRIRVFPLEAAGWRKRFLQHVRHNPRRFPAAASQPGNVQALIDDGISYLREVARVLADDRNYLFEYMMAAALQLRPRLFLMENVPGMQSARREDLSFLEAAARTLQQQGGYRTEVWRLNAAAFGVPQERIRCFLVASRLPLMPARPAEEYQDTRRPDLDHDALPPVTLMETIFDLPERAAGRGLSVERRDPLDPSRDPRFRRYLTKFGILRPSPLLYQHTVRYHNPSDLELYALLRPGEDSIHFLERHRRADLMPYRRDVFDDKYARLRADRPCKTIVAHLAKDGNGYIHPTQVRSLSLREAARVQSFHDGYVFCGSTSDQSQHGPTAHPLKQPGRCSFCDTPSVRGSA